MTQPSSSASACAPHSKMPLLHVLCVIYFAAVCTAQDLQNVPPVPLLKNTTRWLDVFPTEKVKLTCEITNSSEWTFTWFHNGTEIPPSDSHLTLSSEKSVLTITAGPTYSGQYNCQGVHKTKSNIKTQHSNSLKVTVHEHPSSLLYQSPNVKKLYPGDSVNFTCKVSPEFQWEYVWYHGDKEIQASTENSYRIDALSPSHGGQYKCRGRRAGLDGPFSAGTSLHVSEIPVASLRKVTEWMDVFPGETVKLSCGVEGSSDWTYIWYKDDVEVVDSTVSLEASGATLFISSASAAHAGRYKCKGRLQHRPVNSSLSSGLTLMVYAKKPEPKMTQKPDAVKLYVGESVSFECKVNKSSGWEYHWFKDGSSTLKGSSRLIINNATHMASGTYHCTASRGTTNYNTEESEKRKLDVSGIPVASLRRVTEWIDVFPGETVKLSCEVEGSSDWTYIWYKDDVEVVDRQSGATLSISSASAAHAGRYKCKGRLQHRPVNSSLSVGLTLTVYDQKPTVILTKDPDYEKMYPGEPVTFGCHINVSSGWGFEWYKDGSILSQSSNIFSKTAVEESDDGTYKCRAIRGRNSTFSTDLSQFVNLDVQLNKPKPRMIQKPDADKLYVGESVSFECEVEESSGWEYDWFKDGSPVLKSSSNFNIDNATKMESGTYHCTATRDKTNYNTEESEKRHLYVSEIPVPHLKLETQWSDVFPGETVELSCGMEISRGDWTYTWFKDGEEIQPDTHGSLTIESVSSSDSGSYSCTGQFKTRNVGSSFSSELTLQVYDSQPNVTLIQTPERAPVLHTGDVASFLCHINVSSGWQYLWYKNNQPLPQTGPSYTIESVRMSHSALYKCQVRRGADFKEDSLDLNLKVEERPQAEITLLTGWSEVFSTDTLVLQCVVKDSHMWNYTWFRDGHEINLPLSEKHTVTPQDDPEQSRYTCKGVRSERPTYSKESEELKTKNLLLKRRVLLSISGCIFFGIIAVFIGCIVLRVTRKPAPDSERQEENLFLTMAELKIRGDAVSPLAAYITDEELNAPAKEEENGTVCSETTPLPITTETDKDATTENKDKEENNGEMVSFKQ
ncbi:B-cell receptor CD22 isoform X2 [Betta splendens]|uniref:B-cell receptor CD22 isoform X2 n=1 Tax=Betta splendens TaxID=158456 RepID=A0A8M1HH39_BETSP|nr:B-cell receptor CD22 isoform X2 [Betta splendens]